MEKYGSTEIVDLIMARQIWQGMSYDMLIDSIGKPEDFDHKVYKTKETFVLKYHSTGKNRYKTRVKIEDDKVVGWDLK
ncbi:hypothetical protein WJT86_05425 [Microvirga sp. W0021]|uniref:Lipoprotein n=1 Tax=Hohaiivirga grylli TaxID=3133970 RepID=A0ABV0BIL1_9HYPH